MKLASLVILTVILLGFLIGPVHALYTVQLPSNTLFADDFNEYTSGDDLGNGYGTGVNGCPSTGGTVNQCFGKIGGWGWYDNGLGGYRHISKNASFSGPLSIEMASGTQVTPNGKFDMHKMIPTLNTTSIVTMTVYFAFDNFTRNGSGGNNEMTFSIETWDYTTKYECNVVAFPAAATVQIGSPDTAGVVNLRLAALDDTRMIYGTATWHKVSITCDIRNHKYLAASMDNWDLLKQLGVNNPRMEDLPNVEMLLASKPFTIPLRVEFAQLNLV